MKTNITMSLENQDNICGYSILYLAMAICRAHVRSSNDKSSGKTSSSDFSDDESDTEFNEDLNISKEIERLLIFPEKLFYYEIPYQSFIKQYKFQLEPKIEEILVNYNLNDWFENYKITMDITRILIQSFDMHF